MLRCTRSMIGLVTRNTSCVVCAMCYLNNYRHVPLMNASSCHVQHIFVIRMLVPVILHSAKTLVFQEAQTRHCTFP